MASAYEPYNFTLFAHSHTLIFIVALLSLSFSFMLLDKVTLISQLVMLLAFFAVGGTAQNNLVVILTIVQILLAAFVVYKFVKKLDNDFHRVLDRTIHKLER
jgi:hypothetical protein